MQIQNRMRLPYVVSIDFWQYKVEVKFLFLIQYLDSFVVIFALSENCFDVDFVTSLPHPQRPKPVFNKDFKKTYSPEHL